MPLIPPHGIHYANPKYLPQEENLNQPTKKPSPMSINENINLQRKDSQKNKNFNINSLYPPNPSGFLNRDEFSSIELDSFTSLSFQSNSNIKIHSPENLNSQKEIDLTNQPSNNEENSLQKNFNPPHIQNKEIQKAVKEDEKDLGYYSVNGDILNEKNLMPNYNYYNEYYYQSPYGIYEPKLGENNFENGYYPGANPYPNIMPNDYENKQINGLEYNYSARRNSKRIKRLYTGNNNTILEENEENKHTLLNTENSKNQEIRKSNFYKNNDINEEVKKDEVLEKEKLNVKEEKKENSVKNDIKVEEIEKKDEDKIDINDLNKNHEDKIKEINKNENEKNNELIEKKLESKQDNQKIINIKEINYNQIPLYIETEINRALIDEQSQCVLQSGDENINMNNNSFPILIINEDKMYRKFIDFLDSHFKYRQFNFISILKKKLIIPKSDITDIQYKECHNLKHKNIKKFANITNSSQNAIYDTQEINNMVTTVKNILNKDDSFYYQFMQNWIYTVINLMAEFIQFKLKKISYFYYCTNCKFPFIYVSDNFIDELNIDSNNDLLTINNSINIYDDLMKVINIESYNNKNNKNPEFIINVIYYEEEYNYMNYSFEEEINGIFIPCRNMKSFDKTMIEIHDRNIYKYEKNNEIIVNTKNNYMFELIIADIYAEKIFNYLINSNYFQFFKGICILIEEKENSDINNSLLQIKKKYAKYTKDLYITQNDILTFLKREKEDQNYRNNKNYLTSYPVIDYINYLSKYNKLHQGASVYYNKYSINSYKIIEKIFLDFLNTIDNFKDSIKSTNYSQILKEKSKKNGKKNENEKKNNLFNIIKLFNMIGDKITNNNKKEYNENIINIIQKFTSDYKSFYEDFNYWLNNIDQLAHQKLCYFIGSLIY